MRMNEKIKPFKMVGTFLGNLVVACLHKSSALSSGKPQSRYIFNDEI